MLLSIIKYWAILICSLYIYIKLLHIKLEKKACFICMLVLLFFLPVIYNLRIFVLPFSIFITVILFAFFANNFFKTPLNLSLITSIISFGIAYSAFLIAAAIVYFIEYLIFYFINVYPSDSISLVCIGLTEFLLTTIPFKLNRLKNGMPFLLEQHFSDIGTYISITLLLSTSFFGMSKKTDLIFTIPVFFTLLCAFNLIFWWRYCLTKNYIEKLKAKEREELQKTLQEKNLEIEQLKNNNNELSKIIHRDNKLIPAMKFAVEEYLLSAEYEKSNTIHSSKAKELLAQLECLSQERTNTLKNYEEKSKRLPSTNVQSIDALLSYMFERANEHQIIFNLSISGSIKYLIENVIKELDIKTLLADLITNAIIATKKYTKKHIMVNLGISNSYYSIDIWDSGEPFTVETLINIGLKKTTTHLNEGGSGIGLMTTFEISKKYQASFVIEEFFNDCTFMKRVSICFDNLGQYRIITKRAKELLSISKRFYVIFSGDIKSQQTTLLTSIMT